MNENWFEDRKEVQISKCVQVVDGPVIKGGKIYVKQTTGTWIHGTSEFGYDFGSCIILITFEGPRYEIPNAIMSPLSYCFSSRLNNLF